jgi:hypothetical protein
MILFEVHKKGRSIWNDSWTKCQCSYCGGLGKKGRIHYGLNIPKRWGKVNSWWVIKYAPHRYIRWTNRWLLKIKPS